MLLHYFVGVDISKLTLDYAVLKDGEPLTNGKIENSVVAIRKLLQELHRSYGLKKNNTIYCTEHTGSYGNYLVDVLMKRKAKIWVESALRIKRSLGLQRGKSDKTDAFRIAKYSYYQQSNFKQWEPPRHIIHQLKCLISLRKRLITSYGRLSRILGRNKNFLKKDVLKQIALNCQKSLSSIKADKTTTEIAIKNLIRGDDRLHHLFTLVNSVYGVGPILAIELLVVTNEFKNFDSPRKFACYCGVAPFEHTSGTSLRGKTRVSGLGNKKLKNILHMAAVALTAKEGEIREYFKRKVAEGHSKMSVINAIRNKIIHRVFACVRDDRMFITKAGYAEAKRKRTL